MIEALLQPLQARLLAAQFAARGLMLRGMLAGAGVAMALLGFGFLLLALFVALRHAVGTVPAALMMTAALFLTSAALFLVAGRQPPVVAPLPVMPQPAPAPAAAPAENPAAHLVATAAADPVTVAAFTAAFVLGRYLADRRRR